MTFGIQNDASNVGMLQRRAVQLLMAGDIGPAIQAFNALVAARPTPIADDWFNLGYLLRCDRQFEAALRHYDRALALGISGPQEVQLNRAAILSEHLDRQEEAIIALTAALAIDPAYLPALINLATIHEDCGRADAARSAYDRILHSDPLNGRAHGRLTAIDLHQGRAQQALDRLTAALSTGRIRAEDAAEFHFAAGLALDALCRFDDAFAHFVQGNRIARAQIPSSLAYDRRAMEQRVDAIIAAFPAPNLENQAPDRNAALIFICGLFRSGSTLAERLVTRHPLIAAGGERETIPAIADRLHPYPMAIKDLRVDQVAALQSHYLHEIGALMPAHGTFTDKRPDNFLHIGLIKTLFPNAKIIHTRRHPLDNILSIYCLYFADGVSYGFDLDDIVHYMRCHDRLMDHWKSLFGDDIIELDYDILVRDPDRTMRALFSRLAMSWDADCASTQDDGLAVKTASSWHVRKPLNDRSSGRWRNYAGHLAAIRKALALP